MKEVIEISTGSYTAMVFILGLLVGIFLNAVFRWFGRQLNAVNEDIEDE